MSGTAFLLGGCRSFVSRRKTLSDVIGGETVVKQTVRRYGRLVHLFRRVRDSIDASPPAFSASAAKRKEGGGCGGLVAWYLGMVKRQPVLTKSVTCSLIYTVADLSSQTIARAVSEEPPPYDLFRTLRMASYGMILLGPTLHMWFGLMSSLCPKQDLVSTFKKMAMGQAIYGPIMTIVFFSFNAAAQVLDSSKLCPTLR